MRKEVGGVQLKIVNKKKALSKDQKAFNRLTKEIEKIEQQIKDDKVRLDKILDLYIERVEPIEKKIAEKKMILAEIFDAATKRYKFVDTSIEKIKNTILYLCELAFRKIEPNKEQEELYNRWSETSYQEELDEQMDLGKEMFAQMCSEMFDMDIELEGFDESPESFARLQAQLQEKMQEKMQEKQAAEGEKKNTKRKTKKEREREAAQQAEEALKVKSIRSIYIKLAKILHPDTETDPVLRLEKEEVMKEVTKAYQEKDLSKLLNLEMEWVHKTSEHLAEITGDKLKIYIQALNDQVADLKMEKEIQFQNPRYSCIEDFFHMSYKEAEEETDFMLSDINGQIALMESDIERYKGKGIKGELVSLAEQFLMQSQMEMMSSFFESDFDGFEEDDFSFMG